jgi:hypothetical protein
VAAYNPFRTSSDLVLGALEELGVLSPGQPISPEDFSTVNNKLDSILRKLAGNEIVYVADPNNIPGEWFSDLVLIVAGECARAMGSSGEEAGEYINRGLGGWGQVPVGAGAAAQSLKVMLRGRPTGEPLRTDSF